MNEEFYIGWQDKAPKSYGQWVKYVIWTLVVLVPLIAGLLVLSQRGFIASKYEIARLQTLEGILITEPIPCLKIPLGKNKVFKQNASFWEKLKVTLKNDNVGVAPFQRILLVGIGKKSAIPALEALAKKTGKSLTGKGIRLMGKLIYYDGVVAFELGPQKQFFQGFSKLKDEATKPVQLGKATLRGEILDPKCYLGVMRPGEGKPHRSCAIRCLAGGIPAFFKAKTTKGGRQYCFVLDQDGRPINDKLAPYVADEVQLCGAVEQWDNWYVVKADEFKQLMPYWGKGMVMCK
ncbi:hypothetical protein [Haliscomenobacter sp.]|uniref:hypothetical protein n=1 Tax=Haliscomenobacter sp. TaxID=2717303 RepID=UPI003364F6F1